MDFGLGGDDKYDGIIAIYCDEFKNEGKVNPKPYLNTYKYGLNIHQNRLKDIDFKKYWFYEKQLLLFCDSNTFFNDDSISIEVINDNNNKIKSKKIMLKFQKNNFIFNKYELYLNNNQILFSDIIYNNNYFIDKWFIKPNEWENKWEINKQNCGIIKIIKKNKNILNMYNIDASEIGYYGKDTKYNIGYDAKFR